MIIITVKTLLAILSFIAIGFAIVLCVKLCVEVTKFEEHSQNLHKRMEHIASVQPRKSFSVLGYAKRKNQLLLDLCEETKNIEPYIITLRLGYDALRLNADGTMEWINEKPKEEPSITNAWTPSYGDSLADINTQDAFVRLSRAWAATGVSAAQAAQAFAMANAISAIRPAPSWYTSQLSSFYDSQITNPYTL